VTDTNFSVRISHIIHLKLQDNFGFLIVVLSAAGSVAVASTTEDFSMRNRLANCFIAGALVSTLALVSPALAFRGGGGMGMGGGMHGIGGGMGMHGMGMGGGMAMHPMGIGPRAGATSFAAAPMSRAAFGPGFSRSAFPHHANFFHHRFFHHGFNRFAFVGAPFFYAGYNDCWRPVWTQYGLQWVNACGYYGYGY
jgi:hypothetical protein